MIEEPKAEPAPVEPEKKMVRIGNVSVEAGPDGLILPALREQMHLSALYAGNLVTQVMEGAIKHQASPMHGENVRMSFKIAILAIAKAIDRSVEKEPEAHAFLHDAAETFRAAWEGGLQPPRVQLATAPDAQVLQHPAANRGRNRNRGPRS